VAVISCLLVAAPAAATGTIPPNNPPANIQPSSRDWLASINSARAEEGVGPMNVSESQLAAMPTPEQVFVVVNDERIDRGLPPISYMTAQLNSAAQQGANSASDPSFPQSLGSGSRMIWGGSVWAGGLSSVLEADYYWMYSDGLGGTTTNADCSAAAPSGCWGHRDIILHPFASCGTSAPTLSMGAAYSATGERGGSIAAELVGTCGAPPSGITLSWSQVAGGSGTASSAHVIGIATLQNGQGYWEAESNGHVAAFGAATDYGSISGTALNAPIVGIAATPDGDGYWLVASDGGIFAFGDATFFGSTGNLHLNKPIVGMAATQDGGGYWLVASDGGVFTFGDAGFQGSTGNLHLNKPIVGMATDPATGGYWLVGADGGVFSFGAPFFGGTGAQHLAQPITGIESLGDGQGYRFEAADGGVFCFGQAVFDGSMGGHALAAPVVGMAGDGDSDGYWLVASDGGVFGFGNATYYGRITS
jgi:hypothetical protein